MATKVIIQTRCEGVTNAASFRIQAPILFPRQPWDLERMVQAIALQSSYAVNLGRASDSGYIVFFNSPEIVFRLSISKTERRARISATENVCDAVRVAIDRNVFGELVWLRMADHYKRNE